MDHGGLYCSVVRVPISWLFPCNASIINIASVAGKQPGDWNPHYGAIKAAMIHLSKSLSRSLGPSRVRANCICSSTIKGEGAWMRDVESRAKSANVSLEDAERVLEEQVKAKSSL